MGEIWVADFGQKNESRKMGRILTADHPDFEDEIKREDSKTAKKVPKF